MKKQKTFGETVGMEAKVPTRLHRDDEVVCSDGSVMRAIDAYMDCKDGYHSSGDYAMDANAEIVTEVLNGVVEWSDEYHTGNSDYPDGCCHVVDETSHLWNDRVQEWVEDRHCGCGSIVNKIVETVCENVKGSDDCEPEYHPNEYSCYTGDGCCLYSMDLGEIEEQIDVTNHDELMELHHRNELDDVLDRIDRDFCINRSRPRRKNEETGHYEEYGRETYMPYDHNRDHPTFEIYTMPGGQWQWVVSKDRMDELVVDAIIQLCRK